MKVIELPIPTSKISNENIQEIHRVLGSHVFLERDHLFGTPRGSPREVLLTGAAYWGEIAPDMRYQLRAGDNATHVVLEMELEDALGEHGIGSIVSSLSQYFEIHQRSSIKIR